MARNIPPVRFCGLAAAVEYRSVKSKGKPHMKNKAIYPGILLVFVFAIGVRQLPAQVQPVQKEQAERLIGIWGRDVTQDRGNCADLIGDAGENLNNCSLPFDQLPLNERG